MSFQRSIELAIDKNTNTVLDANTAFRCAKDGYDIRTQYNSGFLDLHCLACNQGLMVSDSKNDRLHFKHYPNANDCDLKDGKMSVLEIQEFNEMVRCKESARHKYLKNRIAELLRSTDGVLIDSVIADTKFFFDAYGKRRPDVYCEFGDKKLVFEIQLSNLSQRYLLERTKFYRDNGIYLIWILDQLDIRVQSQMERDIKYLTQYENFFKLDERSQDFALLCTYKSPYISLQNTILYPWKSKPVTLAQITFDSDIYQIYYLNFKKVLSEKEKELAEKLQKKKEYELQQQKQKEEQEAITSANTVFLKLKHYKDKNWSFYKFDQELDKLTPLALSKLNEQLTFATKKYKGKTLLNHYISTATSLQHSFIDFLLTEKRIVFDINARNDEGTTCLQGILFNPYLGYKTQLIQAVFKRGYKLLDEDITCFNSENNTLQDKESELLRIKNYDHLSDKRLIDDVYKNYKVFNIIESAKQHKIIGSNYNNWTSFAVHAMWACKQHWTYIELAFKKFKLWEVITTQDKKNTFQKKVKQLYIDMPAQDDSIDTVVRELYPALFE